MRRIALNEEQLGEAIQQYLEEKGYYVHKLKLVHNNRSGEFSAIATVEGE
ncbi:hypothetical protein [Paenibacillus macquariensis]|uniref:Uncharacterized protein n=1 Tax=Paenibacillus macquariensis TaxID=948756 RepID=A0ABY1JX42_9BACL|nr:hypothetical protein [Paenibacillus macquariensis]MEC0089365.1 hypothetical protein [Paenibacillus macquariensis]SIQ92939.1 hypothetical protein SAMN05421578_10594 [Paenibacillus macquariensis]